MTNTTLMKLAASTMLLGTALVGTQSLAEATPNVATGAKSASRANLQAEAALAARNGVVAVGFAEQAVAAMPGDAGYRATLGQAYLLAGRFQAAETSFSDAIALDPSNGRAALSLALSQIALGRNGAALATLDAIGVPVSVADLGLARALAGDTGRAIEMLTSAARAPDATAKTRQNLALAFALAGKWKEARTVAAQDVSPDEVDQRIAQWAQFTRPAGSWDQVASLLGVTPALDSGQPAQLALVQPTSAPVQAAAALPVQRESEPRFQTVANVVVAPAAENPTPVPVAPSRLPTPAYAVPARPYRVAHAYKDVIVAPVAVPASAKLASLEAKTAVKSSAKPASPVRRVALVRPATTGKFVVQLGAFTEARNVQAAWSRARGRLTQLSNYTPSRSTFSAANASFYRLSVGGFETRATAMKLCGAIRARGGSCFVRNTANEVPSQMAAKAAPRPAQKQAMAPAPKPIRLVSR